MLAQAQSRDRRTRCRVASEMKSAETLERDDEPFTHGAGRIANRVARGQLLARRSEQPQTRTALGTSVWLRVKTAITRIFVLAPALGAHRERRHRCRRAVIRDIKRDREARPAVRTVGEGVAEAAISAIEDLGDTFGAGRHVGGYGYAPLRARLARGDLEVRPALEFQQARPHSPESCRCRRLGGDAVDKAVQRLVRAEGFDSDARRIVTNAAGQPLFTREPVDKRPESDSLRNSRYSDLAARRFQARLSALTHGTLRCRDLWLLSCS